MSEGLGEGARQVRGTPFQAFFLPLLLSEGVKGKANPCLVAVKAGNSSVHKLPLNAFPKRWK
jgi:hypothetical protein